MDLRRQIISRLLAISDLLKLLVTPGPLLAVGGAGNGVRRRRVELATTNTDTETRTRWLLLAAEMRGGAGGNVEKLWPAIENRTRLFGSWGRNNANSSFPRHKVGHGINHTDCCSDDGWLVLRRKRI